MPYTWIERQDPLNEWGWVLFIDPNDRKHPKLAPPPEPAY
jgi:hypothetical protein